MKPSLTVGLVPRVATRLLATQLPRIPDSLCLSSRALKAYYAGAFCGLS
ncbi:MAG: hypothetical protein QOG23_2302 [Blastocatellia bacterium]|nr:hypothetical protein [Blastocatellia bacterium]